VDVIYCAGNNRKFMQVALDCGLLLGVRSDHKALGYHVTFLDVSYRNPDFARHVQATKRLAPKYVVVPDLSEEGTFEEDIRRAIAQWTVLSWYAEIALFVPKLPGQASLLPSQAVLAYSVPTRYGGARYDICELYGRRVHLLGGSPHAQRSIYWKLAYHGEVLSVDGNMTQKMAVCFAKYWKDDRWLRHEAYYAGAEDLYLDCFTRSCANVSTMWRTVERSTYA
jgi:hypothetical protein